MCANVFKGASHLAELKLGSKKDFNNNRPCQPLLLPDEYCLAEDERASFDVHVEKTGFHPFGRDSWFINIKTKIYLTNYRVRNLPCHEVSNPS